MFVVRRDHGSFAFMIPVLLLQKELGRRSEITCAALARKQCAQCTIEEGGLQVTGSAAFTSLYWEHTLPVKGSSLKRDVESGVADRISN